MKVLVLNSGSSSLKYQVIDMETEEMLVKGYFERIGQPNSFLTHKVKGVKHKFEHQAQNHEQAIKFVLSRLTNDHYGVIKDLNELAGIGHRVVHGGEKFSDAVIIDDNVIEEIKRCSELAPLHNPAAILGMEACRKVVPNVKMVAVFDTAFHQTLPKERYIFPIPYEYYEKYKVRRYGFHGTSHSYVSKKAAEVMGKAYDEVKTIVCHLGNGASVSAVLNGKSVDTSMGLTPLEGLVMGTRSGDIDPAIMEFIAQKENLDIEGIMNVLNKKSGVFGLSGEISSDFRDLTGAMAEGDKKAKIALEVFAYRVAKYIGAYAAAMNGVDDIVFTAGIGENVSYVREQVCSYLGYLGVELDPDANEKFRGEQGEITKPGCKVRVFVIPTNEELAIARETLALVK